VYDAIDASSSIAAMPYPCCKAGAVVWLTSVIALAQYSLKESIVLTIGGLSFSRAIQFLYCSEYILSFDDAQADVDDVVIVYRVACCDRVGCADEEARRKGFESVGRIPVGGHSLAIFFTILGCCFTVLCDEPIEHV
jgi:hypothetical protein